MKIKYRDILPAADIADELTSALVRNGIAVVTAPPGAGKSTLLPLTILEGLAPQGKIIMLEPRRIAARQIAARMADMIGEPVGCTVGYRIRFESKVSKDTKIEVVTEGILTRMITQDPTLEGVDVVIFDEFHERSINTDLAIALSLEAQKVIRDDLKLVIMSATIDAESICRRLNAPLIESPGRCFPVQIIHTGDLSPQADIAREVSHHVRDAYSKYEGDILAFLPGESEIRRCEKYLEPLLGPDADIFPLYGMLPFEQQAAAVGASKTGRRKVVLATPVAETSLTVPGVRIVVDSGLCRKMVYDPQSGLSGLQTVHISMDMADQRSGRAGRLADGICYRLWSASTELRMQQHRIPDILEADLSGPMLDICAWGCADPERMEWITPPTAYSVASAFKLLETLGAVKGRNVTPLGRKIASMPCHPRIAGMLVSSGSSAGTMSRVALAADIAAVLDGRDPLAADMSAGVDMSVRVAELRRVRAGRGASKAWGYILRAAQQYLNMVGADVEDSVPDSYDVGALLAAAYPDRVARAVPGRAGIFQLANGELAMMDVSDPMSAEEWIVVASLHSNPASTAPGRIFLAAPLSLSDVSHKAVERDNIAWDARKGCVVAQRERRIGGLVISSSPIHDVSRDGIVDIMIKAAPKEGLGMFDFSDDVASLQRRIAFVSQRHNELGLPDVSTSSILSRSGEWLPMYAGSARSVQELRKIDMCAVIWAMLDYSQQQAVDRIAPSHVEVPTGSRIRLDYRQGSEVPVLRVRLQECFGMQDTPKVDLGRVPVLMELLSPGYKPVQLTSDLCSFWNNMYFEVRGELKRRYPKHYWPENPLEAEPVRGVRR